MGFDSFRRLARTGLCAALLLVSAGLHAAGPGNDRMVTWWHAGTNTGLMYASLENQGLWKTTDGGSNWARVGQLVLGGYVNAVYFSQQQPQIVHAAKDGVPYYSLDGGVNWQVNSWATSQGSGYVNFISGANGDATLVLMVVNRSMVFQGIITPTLDANNNVTGVTGVAISDITAGLPAGTVINAPVRMDGGGNMYLATSAGIFKRAKNAAAWGSVTSQWTPINNGIDSTDLNIQDVRPWQYNQANNVNVITAIGQRNGWKSSDGGATWTNANGNLPAAPHRIWATTDTTYNGVYVAVLGYGIYRSTDGINWTPFQQAVPGETLGNVAIIGNSSSGGTRIIGATGRGLYVAADATSGWNPAGNFQPSNGCSDASLVTAIQGAMDNFAASNWSNIASFFSANYLNRGMNTSAQITRIQAERANKPANISIKLLSPKCQVSTDGLHAVVNNTDLTYGKMGTESGLIHPIDNGSDDWIMIKENGQWKMYGDQHTLPVNVSAGTPTNGDGTPNANWTRWVWIGLDDPNNQLYSGVTVAGPGISGAQPLTFNPNQGSDDKGSWTPTCTSTGCTGQPQFPAGSGDPTNGGTQPLTYTVTATPKAGGSPISAQVTIKGPFLNQGPIALLAPQIFGGNVVINALMPNSADFTYSFQLQNSQGMQMASQWDLSSPTWSLPGTNPPPAGTYTLMVGAQTHGLDDVNYQAQSQYTFCISATGITPGPCGTSSSGPACGMANGGTFTSAPANNLCAAGTASPVSGTGPWFWNCQANGAVANCQANSQTGGSGPIAGNCGPSNGGTFQTAPTGGFCAAGMPSAVTGTGPWSWTCQGVNGGSNASCQASSSGSSTGGNTGAAPAINLSQSWNLLGNGVENSFQVASVFGDSTKVLTVWKWVISGSAQGITYPAWAFYSPTLADGGQSYAASKGYEFLTTIRAGEGFWVNAKTAFSVNLPSGNLVQSSSFMPASQAGAGGTRALPHSWSLIATGDSPTPAQFDARIATLDATPPAAGSSNVYTNLTTLWAWDPARGSWYFWAPSLVNNGGLAAYLTSKQYLDFATMPGTPTGTLSPTTGFWVNMP